MKKTKTIAFYVEKIVNDKKTPIVIEINDKGNLIVTIDKLDMIQYSDLYPVIKNLIDAFVQKLYRHIDQKHQLYKYFVDFNHDSNYEILDISYKYIFDTNQPMDTELTRKCFMPFFNVIEERNNYIRMKYKRVQHYDKLGDIDAFIVQMINKHYSNQDIVKIISSEFDMGLDESKEKMIDVYSKYISEDSKLKVNPGMNIHIHRKMDNYEVEVNNVTHMRYIDFMHKFLSLFMFASQNIILDDEMVERCHNENIVQIDEVVRPALQSPSSSPTGSFVESESEDEEEDGNPLVLQDIEQHGHQNEVVRQYDDQTDFNVRKPNVESTNSVSPIPSAIQQVVPNESTQSDNSVSPMPSAIQQDVPTENIKSSNSVSPMPSAIQANNVTENAKSSNSVSPMPSAIQANNVIENAKSSNSVSPMPSAIQANNVIENAKSSNSVSPMPSAIQQDVPTENAKSSNSVSPMMSAIQQDVPTENAVQTPYRQ